MISPSSSPVISPSSFSLPDMISPSSSPVISPSSFSLLSFFFLSELLLRSLSFFLFLSRLFLSLLLPPVLLLLVRAPAPIFVLLSLLISTLPVLAPAPAPAPGPSLPLLLPLVFVLQVLDVVVEPVLSERAAVHGKISFIFIDGLLDIRPVTVTVNRLGFLHQSLEVFLSNLPPFLLFV